MHKNEEVDTDTVEAFVDIERRGLRIMNHPAELAINQYLEDATSGKSTMSEETVQQIGKDVMDAVRRQFGGGNRRDEFRLRMSNIGKPTCQLWFAKE